MSAPPASSLPGIRSQRPAGARTVRSAHGGRTVDHFLFPRPRRHRQLGQAGAYDVKVEAARTVAPFWPVPHAQVYARCDRMLEAGLSRQVRQESGRNRRANTQGRCASTANSAPKPGSCSPRPVRGTGVRHPLRGDDGRLPAVGGAPAATNARQKRDGPLTARPPMESPAGGHGRRTGQGTWGVNAAGPRPGEREGGRSHGQLARRTVRCRPRLVPDGATERGRPPRRSRCPRARAPRCP